VAQTSVCDGLIHRLKSVPLTRLVVALGLRPNSVVRGTRLTDEGAVVGATLNWNGESPRGYVFCAVRSPHSRASWQSDIIRARCNQFKFNLQLAANKLKV